MLQIMARKLLLISSSKVHGYEYLENAADDIRSFLSRSNVKTVLFVPYASPHYDKYVDQVKKAFSDLRLGSDVRGIHDGTDPVSEVKAAEAIFIGGGNTFLLLKTLYDNNLVDVIRSRVLQDGVPYMGSSAGTNVATISINTTNDMPIVFPPSFSALSLVPFNINPHYLDAPTDTRHMGETRSQRIGEYLEIADSRCVLGLREGSALLVEGDKGKLLGDRPAILFKGPGCTEEFPPGSDLSFLLKL